MIGHNMAHILARIAEANARKVYGAANIERVIKQYMLKAVDHGRKARTSIATGNRWGGPHLHLREKARNARRSSAA